MAKKYKVLAWGDSAVAGTGFGTVTRNVLSSIYKTGKYEIDHLAINFTGDFVDKNEIPWQMQPARLLDPKDPHGLKMFKRTVVKNDYDIVWIINDIYVTNEVADFIPQMREIYESQGKKPPVVMYYYPIDCKVTSWGSKMIKQADVCIAYTDYGKERTLITYPNIENKIQQIPHGVDTKSFFPVSEEERKQFRQELFKIPDDTYLVINVNRNNTRKAIPDSIKSFLEFNKSVPNSRMYLHMAEKDQGGDLSKVLADLNAIGTGQVILPANFNPMNPMPVEILNKIYNCADMFLTTHLGEGWGLTITEAMAAGTPVVAPRNTCMPQQLGDAEERGYMYDCTDEIWIDPSGFRKRGLTADIVNKMLEAHADGPKYENLKREAMLQFTKEHDWNVVNQKWIQLFDKAIKVKETKKLVKNSNLAEEV